MKAFSMQKTHCSEQKSELQSNADLVWSHSFFGFEFLILFFSLHCVIFWINHSPWLHGGKTFFWSLCLANYLLFLPYLNMFFLLFTPHLLLGRWAMTWKVCWKRVSDPFSSEADHNNNCRKQAAAAAAAQNSWSCLFTQIPKVKQKLH